MKTKKRPTTQAHDERRIQIIEHCAELFDKVGYHNMSMQMLADHVGLGKPTLYHYFPSKISILYAMHDNYLGGLLAALRSEESGDPLSSLRSVCIQILTKVATHPGYVRAFMDHYGELTGEMRSLIRAMRQEYFERIQGLVIAGIKSGRFRECDPEITTYGFIGMCNLTLKWYPTMAKERSPEQVADALCLPFFQGLQAD